MSNSMVRAARRLVMAALLVAGVGPALAESPQPVLRQPFLTDSYLTGISARLAVPEPAKVQRILFIGNSITLRHDVPARVAALAAAEGVKVQVALAAAEGARLRDTATIGALRELIRSGHWDVLVLQDYTTTPFGADDRAKSEATMVDLAELAGPCKVVLYPPWPRAPGHDFYTRTDPEEDRRPRTPAEFAETTMAFYRGVAERHLYDVAPVPAAWTAAVAGKLPVYDADNYHASAEGAELAAKVLWDSLRRYVQPSG